MVHFKPLIRGEKSKYWNIFCVIFNAMKKILMLILLAVFLFACQTGKESTAVRYPDPPNKPPRIPSGPAVLVDYLIPPHPDDDDDENKKGRKDGSEEKPTRSSGKDKNKGRDNDRNRR
jgi:hypothetical protein